MPQQQVEPTLFQQLQMLTRTGGPEIRQLREQQQAAQLQQQAGLLAGIPGIGGPPVGQQAVPSFTQQLQDQFEQLRRQFNPTDNKVTNALQKAGVANPTTPKTGLAQALKFGQ